MGYIMGIPSTVLRDENLSPQAKILMAFIFDIYNIKNYEDKGRITKKELINFSKIKKIDYLVLIQELFDYGYVDLDPQNWDVIEIKIPPERRCDATV